MCKRTMYKRARIPMFYGNDAHTVPRPFFLAPAKTAWERGYFLQGFLYMAEDHVAVTRIHNYHMTAVT